MGWTSRKAAKTKFIGTTEVTENTEKPISFNSVSSVSSVAANAQGTTENARATRGLLQLSKNLRMLFRDPQ